MKRALVIGALVAAGCAAKTPGAKSSVGSADIKDFTLPTLDGDRFTLSDHVGDKKVILMSFWATWCAPCLEELPHLEALYQELQDEGLLVVALSMDEPTSMAKVGPTVHRLGLTMPVLLDEEQRAVKLYNRTRSAPMTVILDRTGQVIKTIEGYQPGDETKLAGQVRAWLSES